MEDRVGRKQRETHEHIASVAKDIWNYASPFEIQRLADQTIDEIKKTVHGKRWGVAWSGGKDSVTLAHLLYNLNPCVGMIALAQPELEYPMFEKWVALNKPQYVRIWRSRQDLIWLRDRPRLLFNKKYSLMRLWWGPLQWEGERRLVEDGKLDLLLLGRRYSDGNQCGDRKSGIGALRGGGRFYAPMREWTIPQVIGYIKMNGLSTPPNYSWPNGYIVGTGPWGQRGDVKDENDGWRLLESIDPSIVRIAASVLPGAGKYLEARKG